LVLVAVLVGEAVCDEEKVDNRVPVLVCELEGVWVDVGLSVPVRELEGVLVDVRDGDAVPVCDDEPVADLVELAVCVPVDVPEELPVPVDDELPVPVRDGVCDDVDVRDGVRVCVALCVAVMDGARKHGRTLSTSSTDGSFASTALAMRITRLCAPAAGRLTLNRCHSLRWNAPTCSMPVRYSTVSSPPGDDRWMSTICAWSR
jgi:hypothetical protein